MNVKYDLRSVHKCYRLYTLMEVQSILTVPPWFTMVVYKKIYLAAELNN